MNTAVMFCISKITSFFQFPYSAEGLQKWQQVFYFLCFFLLTGLLHFEFGFGELNNADKLIFGHILTLVETDLKTN